MFAIAFDLIVSETEAQHPKSVSQAYSDIAASLAKFGFTRVQGSLYITSSEDMAKLFQAILALKELAWFPDSVRDIRAFRIEQWSDFTSLVQTDKVIVETASRSSSPKTLPKKR